ncbi:MAG: plastocyanin/azurin family copper-binding protein [Candidatus Krumholzibacteriota bacterium]
MKWTLMILVSGLSMILVSSFAGAVTHTVNQDGLTFSPAEITIEIGDTVEWIWSGGSHTVTSGTNLSDPEVGMLFDEALSSGNPTVSHTFIQVGSQDYFCRPHLNFGMTGTVIITAASPVNETPARTAIRLLPNVPNPFNPTTRITFELPADRAGSMEVGLRIFDLRGRLVRNLLEETVNTDRRTVVWDGRDGRGTAVPAGVYVYRLAAGGRVLSRTMTLVK